MLNEVLADILIMANTSKPAKMVNFAIKLMDTGIIKVTEDELKEIEKIVEDDRSIINLGRAAILNEINKIKIREEI